MEADLRARLAAFDGVHTDKLEELAESLSSDPQVLTALCDLALSDDSKLRSAATWLLKRFSEQGVRYKGEQSAVLLGVLYRESHWEAQVHVLQMLDNLVVTAAGAPALWKTLEEMTANSNRLLRTWSYHGLAVLADQHMHYRDEARAWLSRVDSDAAASLRARARRLHKTFSWLND